VIRSELKREQRGGKRVKTHPVCNARCEGQALQTGPRSNLPIVFEAGFKLADCGIDCLYGFHSVSPEIMRGMIQVLAGPAQRCNCLGGFQDAVRVRLLVQCLLSRPAERPALPLGTPTQKRA
jgi:hypothetical protein